MWNDNSAELIEAWRRDGAAAQVEAEIDSTYTKPDDTDYTDYTNYTGGGGEEIEQLTRNELYYDLMLPVNEKYELIDMNGNVVEPNVIIFKEIFESVVSGVEWLVVYTIEVS